MRLNTDPVGNVLTSAAIIIAAVDVEVLYIFVTFVTVVYNGDVPFQPAAVATVVNVDFVMLTFAVAVLYVIFTGNFGFPAALTPLAGPVPALFVAVTVNVYITPSVKLLDIVIGDAVPVAVAPSFRITVYPVIGYPPVNVGAVNAIDAVAVPLYVTPVNVGAGGTPGEMLLLAELDKLLPIKLVANTVNVYGTLFVRPVTVIGDDVPVAVIPPGDEVTVYWVTAYPPLLLGAVNDTGAEFAYPYTVDTPVGAVGTTAGIKLLLAAEGKLEPALLFATTVNV
jgi:hypothetical protein